MSFSPAGIRFTLDSSFLRPAAVSVDKGPIDFKTEARLAAKMNVTIAQGWMLAKEAIPQRIGLRPTV